MRDACRAPVGAFNNLWIPGYLVFRTPHLVGCLLNVYTLKRSANLFALVDGLVNKDLICFILVLSSTEFSTCLQINNTTQMLAKFSAPWLKGRFLFLSWNNWNLSKWCEQRRKVRWSVKRLNALQKGINGNETKVPWHEGSEWLTITSRTQFEFQIKSCPVSQLSKHFGTSLSLLEILPWAWWQQEGAVATRKKFLTVEDKEAAEWLTLDQVCFNWTTFCFLSTFPSIVWSSDEVKFFWGSREHAISLSMGHNRPEKLHCSSEWRLNKIWFWNQNSHNLRNTLMFEICSMSILTLRLEISRAKMFGCFWSGVAWLCGQGGRQDPGPGQLYRFPATTQHHTITLPHHDRQEGSRHTG